MSVDFLHEHSRIDSPLRRLPAGLKLAVALGLVLATILQPKSQFPGFAVIAVLLMIAVVASKLPPLFLLTRLVLLEPFVMGVAMLTLFQSGGGRVFLAVMLKTNLCLLTTVLLSNTTPFGEVLRVLRRLRVPWLFVTTLALMHRYLFVLADESERMRRARLSRTFTRGRRFQWRTLATVIGQLFVRASERAERIYSAMCARGWK